MLASRDVLDADAAILDMVPEVMGLDVEMFRLRYHLWDLGHFDRSCVVFECCTVDGCLRL